MSPLVVAAIALGGLALMEPTKRHTTVPDAATMQIIVDAARRRGVPVAVALAFADLESNFDPRAQGDKQWPFRRGGSLYRQHVLDNPRLRLNPARLDPSVWTSYGLFQLLAAHHVRPLEHPHELYDAQRNADGGCSFIAQLMAKAGGDVRRARLAYIGCGLDGSRCDAEHVQKVSDKLQAALAKWRAVG